MNKLKITVLSLSLLTVMAGSAPAPALAEITRHFSDYPLLLIKMVISLPGIFIMITALSFTKISQLFTNRTLAISGLIFYLVGGCGAALANDIYTLLIFRAVLGLGVGLFMPLSTGLISYYFEEDQQQKLMGYSSALNNFGGVIGMAISGLLVSIEWRYSFLVYLMGVPALILMIMFLPHEEKAKVTKTEKSSGALKQVLPYGIGVMLIMIIFYTLPTNFALVAKQESLVPTPLIGTVMAVQTLAAVIVGLKLSSFFRFFKTFSKYVGAICLLFGYLLLSFPMNLFFTILALFIIGLGVGFNMPMFIAQFSLHSSKENTNKAMAFFTGMVYFGQFISPIFIKGIQSSLHVFDIRFPFYTSVILAIILLLFVAKIDIRIAVKKTKN